MAHSLICGSEREGERRGGRVGEQRSGNCDERLSGHCGEQRGGRMGERWGGRGEWRSERGSFILEYAVVFLFVFLASCLVVYIAILMFESAAAQSAADYAAISASAAWYDGDGAALLRGLYLRLQNGEATNKAAAVARIAGARLKGTSLRGMSDAGARAVFNNGLLATTVFVGIGGTTVLPERRVLDSFQLESGYRLAVGGLSVIPDAPNSIRKIDFALDIEHMLEKASPEFKKVADNFRGMVNKVHGFIGGGING